MKVNWFNYLALCVFTFIGCQPTIKDSNQAINLPYYNEATFTPEWIEQTDPDYDQIHTIAPFVFEDQNGQKISSDQLEGKVYVANFFFSICVNVCPKMTKNLLVVQDSFRNDDRVQLISHTVMPWVDSVSRLKEYAQVNEIDDDKWHLVTGDQDEIYALARESYFADEGFGKSVTDPNDFLHTEKMILIDQRRRIRGVYNGTIPLEMKRMIEDIKQLLNETS